MDRKQALAMLAFIADLYSVIQEANAKDQAAAMEQMAQMADMAQGNGHSPRASRAAKVAEPMVADQ
jgi:hypothetical protein